MNIHLWSLKLLSLFMKKKKQNKVSLTVSYDSFNSTLSFQNNMVTLSCQEDAVLEMARQSLASRRLSFEKDDSCSVLSMVSNNFPFKNSLVLAMETENPYMDFLFSMEQMAQAHGLKPGGKIDWEFLEDLLTWFLRINNMKNQDFIVAAFVDLCLFLSSSN